MSDDDDDQHPKWLDRVAGALGAIGFNQVRVRWKLQRWVTERRQARRRREQAVEHLKYEHRVCPKCTAVNARDEKVCTRCGTSLSARPVEMLGRLGVHGPVIKSMTTLVSFAILICYARIGIANHGAWEIGIPVLDRHGGNLPLEYAQDWWTSLTSVFLHAGALHLAFNLVALAVVGPHVEEDYGRWPMLFLFVATGIAASLFSRYTGLDGVGIGASGAVSGLLGVTAAAGHRAGTPRGKHHRNDMLKWAIFILFFGFIVGADNRAHLGGFLAGGAFALLVPPRVATRTKPARVIGGVLGGLAMLAMIGAVALIMKPDLLL